jgi:hypothetical protein
MKAQYFLNRLNRLNLLEPFCIPITPIVCAKTNAQPSNAPSSTLALHLYFPADAVTFT